MRDQQEITARPGQDVPLQCQGPRDASVKLLEWNRPDLKSDGYVFFYRNERSYENYLLPSFRGRVELSDPEMKGGDFSVVLKNVTTNDSGTYECRAMIVTLNETTPSEIRNLVPLTVTDADHTAANIWDEYFMVTVSVIGGLIIIFIISFVVFWKTKKKETNQPTSSC
ncbi:coxsackievirus and adenovirus receptor homolog isoform X2 [Siniperca chuatsi]|uniref:coxsackievirus and adenovirus receptor homolog isoform X2 n=1 Tax=Siniperca chuatsi TaxID=119488 RepID=UPI001CE0ED6B|nr:coxsackievirus and adenovirus receptor homolog isoform X2 [Siniperca chuatsi]